MDLLLPDIPVSPSEGSTHSYEVTPHDILGLSKPGSKNQAINWTNFDWSLFSLSIEMLHKPIDICHFHNAD